jgi:hypothetical protein
LTFSFFVVVVDDDDDDDDVECRLGKIGKIGIPKEL